MNRLMIFLIILLLSSPAFSFGGKFGKGGSGGGANVTADLPISVSEANVISIRTATDSVSGAISAADHTKLTTLDANGPNNATAYAATQALAIVKTRTGATRSYYPATDTNEARGIALLSALNSDLNDCTLITYRGDCNLGTNAVFDANFTWEAHDTNVISWLCAINPSNFNFAGTFKLKGINFYFPESNGSYSYGIRLATNGSKVTIEDCTSNGNSDFIYAAASSLDLTVRRCDLYSNYDLLNSTVAITTGQVTFEDCNQYCKYSSAGVASSTLRCLVFATNTTVPLTVRRCKMLTWTNKSATDLLTHCLSIPRTMPADVYDSTLMSVNSGTGCGSSWSATTDIIRTISGTGTAAHVNLWNCRGSLGNGDVNYNATPTSTNYSNFMLYPAPKTPYTLTTNAILNQYDSGKTFDINGNYTVTLPQAGNDYWELTFRDVNNTAGCDPCIKPYNGDNGIKVTGTILTADACQISDGDAYAKAVYKHFPNEPNINREDFNVGLWTQSP